MLIDATDLMFITFQRCRNALSDTEAYLNVLSEALEKVKQKNSLVVNMPRHLLSSADETARERILRSCRWNFWYRLALVRKFPTESQQLFSLVYVGTSELQRLWASESEEATSAVRALGYAFHNIPRFLRDPKGFKRDWYTGCVQIAGRYWDQLSPEMQQMFCSVMQLDIEQIVALINSQESD